MLSGIAAMLCCVGHDFMNSLPGQRQLRCLGFGSASHVMSWRLLACAVSVMSLLKTIGMSVMSLLKAVEVGIGSVSHVMC